MEVIVTSGNCGVVWDTISGETSDFGVGDLSLFLSETATVRVKLRMKKQVHIEVTQRSLMPHKGSSVCLEFALSQAAQRTSSTGR